MECEVPECYKIAHEKMLCRNHYWRLWKYGDSEYPIQRSIGRSKCIECDNYVHKNKLCSKHYRYLRKKIIVWHYSRGLMRCVCCEEKEFQFLQVDHINNDGAQHRRELRYAYRNEMYEWLIKNNLPQGFQILCANCNFGKYVNKGVCPHKIRW